MNQSRKIVIAITGASGSIYANAFLKKASIIPSINQDALSLILSTPGTEVSNYELGKNWLSDYKYKQYPNDSFFAPFASGSSDYDAMVILPCTMGSMGRIASGTSNDLITRTADVMLKERKKLILVVRETPFSLIHIRNMETITLAGGIIMPASPSFYTKPKNINELVLTVVDRIFDQLGIPQETKRWDP